MIYDFSRIRKDEYCKRRDIWHQRSLENQETATRLGQVMRLNESSRAFRVFKAVAAGGSRERGGPL